MTASGPKNVGYIILKNECCRLVSPLRIGLWDPFHSWRFFGLQMGCDPDYLTNCNDPQWMSVDKWLRKRIVYPIRSMQLDIYTTTTWMVGLYGKVVGRYISGSSKQASFLKWMVQAKEPFPAVDGTNPALRHHVWNPVNNGICAYQPVQDVFHQLYVKIMN